MKTSWIGYIARLIGGVIFWMMLVDQAGFDPSFWNAVLYWIALILITEGGAWVTIRNAQRDGEL